MFEIISDQKGIAEIESGWKSLATRNGFPLADFEWNQSAAKAFADNDLLKVVVSRSDGGSIRAIAPLAISAQGGTRHLTLLGSDQLGEPGALLYHDADSLADVVAGMLSLKLPIRLPRLSGFACDIEAVRRLIKFPYLSILSDAPGSLYIPIADEWGQFESQIPARTKERIRRAGRLASRLGPVLFTFERPGPSAWRAPFEEFVKVEAASWKGREGSAMLVNPPLKSFFEDLCSRYVETERMLFSFLRIGERRAACVLGLLHSNCLWILKTGYDEQFSRCSPGILIMHECVRYAHENGCGRVEFLGLPEEWLEIWTRVSHATKTLRIYNYSTSGALSFTRDVSGFCLRTMNKAIEDAWT